jgi:transketolase
MAIAERWLANYFNRPTFKLFDYDVDALCGDGCMMEGISGEAPPCSKAANRVVVP